MISFCCPDSQILLLYSRIQLLSFLTDSLSHMGRLLLENLPIRLPRIFHSRDFFSSINVKALFIFFFFNPYLACVVQITSFSYMLLQYRRQESLIANLFDYTQTHFHLFSEVLAQEHIQEEQPLLVRRQI